MTNFINKIETAMGSTEATTGTAGLWGYLDSGGSWVDIDSADYMAGRFGKTELQFDTEELRLYAFPEGEKTELAIKWINKVSKDAHVLGETQMPDGTKVTLFLNVEKSGCRGYIGLAAQKPYTPPVTGRKF